MLLRQRIILKMYPFLSDGTYESKSYDTFKAVSFGGWPRAQQGLNCWARCNAMYICVHTYAHTFNMNLCAIEFEAHRLERGRSGRNNMFWSCRRYFSCRITSWDGFTLYSMPQFKINGRRGLLYLMCSQTFSSEFYNNIKNFDTKCEDEWGLLWCP